MILLLLMLIQVAPAPGPGSQMHRHTVSLAWTASPDAGVSYNVYRTNGTCPNPINDTTMTQLGKTSGLAYVDSFVPIGPWCYYGKPVLACRFSRTHRAVVLFRSFDAFGQESTYAPSNTNFITITVTLN